MKSFALFKEYVIADFQRYEPRPFFPYFFFRMIVYPYFRLLVVYRFLTCFGRCGGHVVVAFEDILCLFTKTHSCRITIKCKDWKRMYVQSLWS